MKKTAITFIIILFLAFIIRLVFTYATPGDAFDIGSMIEQGQQIKETGLINTYDNNDTAYPIAIHYPPLWKYILGGLAYIPGSIISPVSLKMLAVMGDLLTGLAIFFILSPTKKPKLALLASGFYLFNPAIIYESAVWGQWDSLFTLFVLLAIYFVTVNRPGFSLVALTIGLLLKMQTIVFFPLVIFLILKKYYGIKKQSRDAIYHVSRRKIILGFIYAAGVFILVNLPFILAGKTGRVIEATIGKAQTNYPYLSVSAFNIWWLPTLIKSRIHDHNLIFNLISYKLLGLTIFSLSYLFIFYFLHKKFTNTAIWLAAAYIAFAFFMLPTEMHERYLFPYFAFLSIIWLSNKKLWPLYLGLSLTFLISLACFITPPAGPQSIQDFFILISEVMAIINIALFVYMVVVLVSILYTKNHKSQAPNPKQIPNHNIQINN